MQANISDNVSWYKCLLQYTYTGLLNDKTPLAYISLWARRQLSSVTHTEHMRVHTHICTHAHSYVHTYISKCCCKHRVLNFPASKVLNVEGCNLESLTWWHLLTQQHSELKEHDHSLQLHSSLATVYSSRQQCMVETPVNCKMSYLYSFNKQKLLCPKLILYMSSYCIISTRKY